MKHDAHISLSDFKPRKTPVQLRVEQELAAIERAYKKVNASPESARRFLKSIGLLDEKGELASKYRS